MYSVFLEYKFGKNYNIINSVMKNSSKTCKKGSQCCAIQPKNTNANGKGDKPRPVCKNTYNKNYDSINWKKKQ